MSEGAGPHDGLNENPVGSQVSLFGPCEWACIASLVVLVVSAFGHYLQINDPNAYRNSPLIAIEFVTLIFAMVSVPGLVVLALWYLFQRNFRHALVAILLCVATCIAMAWALWIDAATLIYMT